MRAASQLRPDAEYVAEGCTPGDGTAAMSRSELMFREVRGITL